MASLSRLSHEMHALAYRLVVLEDAGAAHVIATAIDAESAAHGGRIVLDGHLSEIVEAHRYLDSIDCLGKTVVLPEPVGARG